MRARCASVTSRALVSPLAMERARAAASSCHSSGTLGLLDDARDLEAAVLDVGRGRERILLRQALPHLVLAEDVHERERMRGRLDPLGGDVAHARGMLEDLRELRAEPLDLVIGERETGQARNVTDFVGGQGHDGPSLPAAQEQEQFLYVDDRQAEL